MNNNLPLNEIASDIAGLGIPGLLLLIAIEATGLSGGAAIVAALVALGPGGMVGGILFLVASGLLAQAIAQYSIQEILVAVVRELLRQGYTKESLKKQVSKYWVSNNLKYRLYEVIDKS